MGPLSSPHRFLVLVLAGLGLNAGLDAYELQELSINGFVSQGYLHSTGNNYFGDTRDGSFEFNEIGLALQAELTDDLRVGLQLFSHDLGELGNNEVVIDWAYADYRHADSLGLRLGRAKIPLGLYNESRDIDIARPQIFLPEAVYLNRWRDSITAYDGAQAYGHVMLDAAGELAYQAYLGTLALEPDGAVALTMEEEMGLLPERLEVEAVYGLALAWSPPMGGLRLSTTWMRIATLDATGAAPDGARFAYTVDDLDAVFFGAEYTWGPWTFAAEYMRWGFDAVLDLHSPLGTARHYEAIDRAGWYVSAAYECCDQLTLFAVYDELYRDIHDRDGNEVDPARGWEGHQMYHKEVYAGVRYDINDHWVVKGEVHAVHGSAVVYELENDRQTPDEDWYFFALKTTVVF
ncbi:MAG: hypothetical protein ACOCYP_07060 [Planctomycetota bacterium]